MFSKNTQLRGRERLRDLLREVRAVARPGGLLLIADIPGRGALLEAAGFAWSGWREGFLLEALRFLWRARRSEYRELRDALGLLSPSDADLLPLARAEGLEARLLHDRVTVNPGRRHFLVTLGPALARPRTRPPATEATGFALPRRTRSVV